MGCGDPRSPEGSLRRDEQRLRLLEGTVQGGRAGRRDGGVRRSRAVERDLLAHGQI